LACEEKIFFFQPKVHDRRRWSRLIRGPGGVMSVGRLIASPKDLDVHWEEKKRSAKTYNLASSRPASMEQIKYMERVQRKVYQTSRTYMPP